MRFVIVGSGPAGIFAAEAIRRRDKESPVTMVTADRNAAYSPVMLSYWVAGDHSEGALFFRDPSWSERMSVEVRPGARAESLDAASRKLILTGGEEVPYDRLLIAAGASPISLPLPGIGVKGVASFRTLSDAEGILGVDRDGGNVVIIGGGFIGLKLACHLKERGLGVTILEREARLAFRMFDLKTSRTIEKKLRENGIPVETGVEAAEVLSEKGWVSAVKMKDGRILPCRRIVETVGVRPNIRWLAGSGIDLKGGIPVDERLETNVSGVYAAGDVAITVDSITSEKVNNATWPAATRQGTVAGTNMAGGRLDYIHNYAMNALNLFGLPVMAAGHSYVEEGAGVRILSEERGETYRKMVIRDGRLIGFILIGDTSGAGLLLSLIKRKEAITRLAQDLLSSPPIIGRKLPPNLGFRHGRLFS